MPDRRCGRRELIGAARAPTPERPSRTTYGDDMDVGIQTIFASYGWDGISDAQVYEEDTRLALLAAELGFDVVWAVEHHFFDYSFCPDNVRVPLLTCNSPGPVMFPDSISAAPGAMNSKMVPMPICWFWMRGCAF